MHTKTLYEDTKAIGRDLWQNTLNSGFYA